MFLAVPILITQVKSVAPPVASFTYSPDIPGPGENIVFDASSSYASNGWIVSYTWDFGEGNITTVTTPIITHQYTVDCNYTVQLTVTDSNGLTGVASAVIQVRTVVFFRLCAGNTLIPLANAQVTVYYYNYMSWTTAPVGPSKLQIKYDNMTQPNLARTDAQRNRNPGYTASILRDDASNIGFDIHPECWAVFFKFQYGPFVAYWPDSTTTVYSYKKGLAETHNYLPGHRAYWDARISEYVIKVGDIPGSGVSPCEEHPIIVHLQIAPPPTQRYYLSVRTAPSGITTIPGQGFYLKGTNVSLAAPTYVNVSADTRYRFSYWDLDGAYQGSMINPIIANMNSNHTATAHYVTQYFLAVSSLYGSPSPVSGWFDCGSSIVASVSSPVSGPSGTQHVCSGWTGTGNVPPSGSGTSATFSITQASSITWNWKTQYRVTFNQTGAGLDFIGTALTIDGTNYGVSGMPVSFWWDSCSTHTFAYQSPLVVTSNAKKYVWTSTTGLSTSQSGSLKVTTSGIVTGGYKTQYYLIVTSLYDSPTPTSGWFDDGTNITASVTSPTYALADTRYVCTGWSGTGSVPTSGSSTSVSFTINRASSITWTWKTQYQVIFDQTGVGGDFTGKILTIDGIDYNGGGLPTSSFWWDQDSNHTFSFASPLVVNSNRRYVWSSTSGLSTLQIGTLKITTSGSVVGNYVVQNLITFDVVGASSDFTGIVLTIDSTSYTINAFPLSFNWSIGSVHYFFFQSPLVVSANSKKYVWTGTTGLSTLQSDYITVATYGSIIGNYKTQYYLTVVTSPPGITSPSGSGWYDQGTCATISSNQYVPGVSRYRFDRWTTADMSEITDPASYSTTVFMDKAKTLTANYVLQYQVTFSQSGVGTDFAGTVVTIDGTGYTVSTLSTAVFWWDNGSNHTFSFASPLTVDVSKSYVWISTSGGLTSLQSGTLTVTNSGGITGNYAVCTKCQITFSQTGVSGDFSDTVVIIDGVNYKVTDLSASFWWVVGSVHTFAYQSPLVVTANGKQYIWTSTTGLSAAESGYITVSANGSVIGSYKTQYYLVMATNPLGVASPFGAGWYDDSTNATISAPAFVDIVLGSSRYRFNGWTTTYMSEIADPTRSPTKVKMEQAKTVTANYVVQYYVTLSQSGVGVDFTGTVVVIDGVDCKVTNLSASFWWDASSVHTFAYQSPLVVTANAMQYIWTGTTGLSTLQGDSITVSTAGSVTGNYRTQYYLTVTTNPAGITTIPSAGWYGASSTATLTAPAVTGYQFNYWDVDGTPQGIGNYTIKVNMNGPHNATAHYTQVVTYTLAITATTGGTTNPAGTCTYSGGTTANVTATPNAGYRFDHWVLDGSNAGSTSSISVLMDENHSLQAVFAETHTLAISVSQGGTTNPAPGTYTYQTPTDVSVTATPYVGYRFDHWVYDDNNIGSQNTVEVHVGSSHTLTAIFVPISPSPVGGYSISLMKQTPVSHIATYTMLIALFGVVLSLIKRKRK
jgi:hypothetical protein